jgi:hypothetical protein
MFMSQSKPFFANNDVMPIKILQDMDVPIRQQLALANCLSARRKGGGVVLECLPDDIVLGSAFDSARGSMMAYRVYQKKIRIPGMSKSSTLVKVFKVGLLYHHRRVSTRTLPKGRSIQTFLTGAYFGETNSAL